MMSSFLRVLFEVCAFECHNNCSNFNEICYITYSNGHLLIMYMVALRLVFYDYLASHPFNCLSIFHTRFRVLRIAIIELNAF